MEWKLRDRITLMRFYNNRLLATNLCRLALGGQTVKILRLPASKFELDQTQRKTTKVDASGWPNETQLNASPKLASTCKSVWPGLKARINFLYKNPFNRHRQGKRHKEFSDYIMFGKVLHIEELMGDFSGTSSLLNTVTLVILY